MYITMMIEAFGDEEIGDIDFDAQDIKTHETEETAIEEFHRLEKKAIASGGNGFYYRPLKIKV